MTDTAASPAAFDFDAVKRELIASLAEGTVDIGATSREAFRKSGADDIFVEAHIIGQLDIWRSVASNRLAEHRASRIAELPL